MWFVTVLWVHRLWGFPGDAGQGPLPLVFCLGPLGVNYKAMCRWRLLVPGLGLLSERCGDLGSAAACLSIFRKV